MKRLTYGSAVLLLALGIGCQHTSEEGMGGTIQEAQPEGTNTLLAEEQAEGWALLFDGTDLSQWRGFKREDLPASWKAAGGTLYFDGSGGGDIITKEQYANFELKLDWKISEGGNSGIFFRVTEDEDRTYFSGPEVQILDNERHPDAKNGLDRTAGANYALHVPSKDVTKPAGEWNSVRLVVNGAEVEHWLNGEQVVAYTLWSDDWELRVAESKFFAWPAYGMSKVGHIALQDHSDPVWFRNIKIRRLGDDEQKS